MDNLPSAWLRLLIIFFLQGLLRLIFQCDLYFDFSKAICFVSAEGCRVRTISSENCALYFYVILCFGNQISLYKLQK
jgi:hypothetical protein